MKSNREHWERDSLYRMRAYRLACDLFDDCWDDSEKLGRHPVTVKTAGQLYRAVGSIKANLADGYSRSSGRDRVRLYEYALSSARESMVWYDGSPKVLGQEVVRARVQILEEIRRLLLATIPRERDRLIRPTQRKNTPKETDAD
ncbi:MAG: four helix bundle protein [Gemmatimonadaceae bacterium]